MSDGLPSLRVVIADHGLNAQKSLGQNFLLDLNLTRRIARTAGDLHDSTVYEIGPGPGGLTRALLMEGAAHVVAVELDPRAIAAQNEIAAAYPGRLTIVEGDALQTNEQSLLSAHTKIKVVANLPYNVGTPLLIKWLCMEPWPSWFQSLTLMFQREVAERIVAKPRTKDYGRLSVIAQARCTAKIAFDVPAAAFVPPPKVTSSVVHLVPKPWEATFPPVRILERVTAAAFGQRRKMLRASLKTLLPDPLPLLAAADIPETARAEEVSVDEFIKLAAIFANSLRD